MTWECRAVVGVVDPWLLLQSSVWRPGWAEAEVAVAVDWQLQGGRVRAWFGGGSLVRVEEVAWCYRLVPTVVAWMWPNFEPWPKDTAVEYLFCHCHG